MKGFAIIKDTEKGPDPDPDPKPNFVRYLEFSSIHFAIEIDQY